MIEEVNKMSEISTLKKPLETAEEYVQSLRDMKTEIWALGEKITGIPDHPLFVPNVNAVAKTYEMPFPVKSHLTGHTINRFNHIHQSKNCITLIYHIYPQNLYLIAVFYGIYLLFIRLRYNNSGLQIFRYNIGIFIICFIDNG